MNYRFKRILPVLGMLVLFVCVALAIMGGEKSEIKQPLPPSLDNLAGIKLVEVKDAGGQIVLSGSFTMTTKDNGDIDGETALTTSVTGAKASGKAEVEIATKNGNVVKELEVDVRKLTSAATFTLFIDGQQVAVFTTSQKGAAELEMTNQPRR